MQSRSSKKYFLSIVLVVISISIGLFAYKEKEKTKEPHNLIRITPGLGEDVERFSFNVTQPAGPLEFCPHGEYEVDCNLLITVTSYVVDICQIWLIPNETTNTMVLLNSDFETNEIKVEVGSSQTYYLPYDYQTYTLTAWDCDGNRLESITFNAGVINEWIID